MHRIRLPAPWQQHGAGDCLDGSAYSRWQIERTFQKPTGLSVDSRLAIELLIEASDRPARLAGWLNSHELSLLNSTVGPALFPLASAQLQATNQLILELEYPSPRLLALPKVALLILQADETWEGEAPATKTSSNERAV